MATPSRMKKVTLSAMAALGATAGAAGIAAAATSQSTPTDPAPAAQQPAGSQEKDQGAEHDVIVDAGNGKVLAQEAGDDYADDAAEQANLAKLAKVSADDAVKKATTAVPGKAGPAELDEENGKVVYEVEITKADNTSVDVIVDAVNGDVIAQETDDDTHEANEAPDGAKGAENNTEAPTTTQGN